MKPISINYTKNTSITERTSNSLKIYFKEVAGMALMTPDEEMAIAIMSSNGDTSARHKLVKANLRFVISVANKFQTKEIPFEDLVNQGNIGLVKAAESFNPNKGFRFITYAVWHIQSEIINHIRDCKSQVRLPSNKSQEIKKMNKQFREFEKSYGRTADVEELVELYKDDLAVTVNRKIKKHSIEDLAIKGYNNLIQLQNTGISYFDKKEDEGFSLAETIPDDSTMGLDATMIENDFKTGLLNLLDKLKPRNKAILMALYGLDNGEPKSLKEVADMFGLTKQNIGLIREKELKKLRPLLTPEILQNLL